MKKLTADYADDADGRGRPENSLFLLISVSSPKAFGVQSSERPRFRLEIPRDQARAFVERDVSPGPLHEDGEAIAEADQENDVDEKPDQPGQPAAQVDEIEVGHGFVPADGRHAALVPIAKALRLPAFDHRHDIARGVPALLHRHWRNARQRLAALVSEARQVANHHDFGMARDAQVFVHDHAAAFIDWNTDRFSDERSDVARGPNL